MADPTNAPAPPAAPKPLAATTVTFADRLKGLGRYLLNRAGERSTWQGLAAAATAAGIAMSPAQVEAITATGLAVVGLLHVLIPDPKP